MAHLGVFCPPSPGHLDPMLALAGVLRNRGHQITVFQVADMEERVRAGGHGFWKLGEDEYTRGTLSESLRRLGTLSGLEALRFSVECGRKLALLGCTEGPAAVRQTRVDALLVDQNEPAGGSVAEHLGIPFVSICSGLPVNRESRIAPSFTSWPYNPSVLARLRNYAGYRMADLVVAPIERVLNDFRRKWNLPLLRGPDDSFSRLAQLSQTIAEFDFPRCELPESFHHVGPFTQEKPSGVSFPFGRLDGRPLIYASLGTLQNGDMGAFEKIAIACAGLDAQLVISLGQGNPTALPDLPGSPVVVSYAPQLELISRSTLVITHAGLNTVLGALSHGVPMVAIPITNDQPGAAARLLRCGAGEVVPFTGLTAARLRQAVHRVMSGHAYRAAAAAMRDAIRCAGGVQRAADIIEHVLPSGAPVAPRREMKQFAAAS